MSKPSNIAIVGITGDPPTLGHIWLAQTVDATGDFDEVWLMPCFEHKFGKKTTDAGHRLVMTKIAAWEAGGHVIASNFEIEHRLNGACHATAKLLREEYPTDAFTWVIGMDNALNLDMWDNSTQLKKGDLISFLVCGRTGVAVPSGPHWFYHSPHRYIEDVSGVECSSSDFRFHYRRNCAECTKMVSPGVLAYIFEHDLYKEFEQ